MLIPQARPPRQRGITLVVVLVFVLLSTLLALWASRTALFNELVVGNDTDYQRAFEAAQAMLQDAELDIRGERANGKICIRTGGKVCRQGIAEQIPLEAKDITDLIARLSNGGSPTGCKNGLCAKRTGVLDFWNDQAATSATGAVAMKTAGIGARYGEFTGAKIGSDGAPSNPLLRWGGSTNTHAWYWIEVLPYLDNAGNANLIVGGNANLLAINLVPSVVYRITALATGLKPNTVAVIQETYAPSRLKD